MTYRILLDPQGGDGSGTPAPVVPDPAEGFKALLAKNNNDAMAMAERLHRENYGLRQKNKALKSSVPEEGAVVLKGDDAKKWAKFRELGDPAEVKASLESGKVAAQKLEGIGRAETYRKAATLGGYSPEVFADLAESKGFSIEIAEETRDDKVVEVAFVKGEGDSRTPLKKFVESHLSSYLPALMQGQSPKERDRSRDATPPRRSPFVAPRLDDDADEERGLVGRAAYAT